MRFYFRPFSFVPVALVRSFIAALVALSGSLFPHSHVHAQELPFLENREALQTLLGNALAC